MCGQKLLSLQIKKNYYQKLLSLQIKKNYYHCKKKIKP